MKRKKSGAHLAALVFLAGFISFGAFPAAAGAEEMALTLGEAKTRALSGSSYSLRSAELSYERSELSYADTQRQFERTMAEGYDSTGSYQSALVGLQTSYTRYQSSERDLEISRESLELAVTEAYWKVLTSQAALALAEENQRLGQRELSKNQLFAQTGTISAQALQQARTNFENAKITAGQRQDELDAAYRAFNLLVRLPEAARPVLTDRAAYAALEVVSLDYHTAKILEEHPQMWELKQNVTSSRASAELLYYQGGSDPYRSGQISVEQAVLDYEQGERTIRDNVRAMYEDIIKSEQNIALAEQAALAARDDYAAAELQYAWGTISELDFLNAGYAVRQAEANLFSLYCSHDLALIRFVEPWL
jgi:outer membrane protein TolC